MRNELTLPVGDSAFLDERLLKEDPPEARSEGERDRDRILYASALQRLGGIIQVSPPESGYAFHTRLIHSVKVSQVAQRIAQRLKVRDQPAGAAEILARLDVDAVEAAGLAHDLGHPPFGHIAETELKQLAVGAELDGFEGNAQSFRILTRLGTAGPFTAKSTGLNLTRRTLNGTLKYPWLRNSEDPERKDKWVGMLKELTWYYVIDRPSLAIIQEGQRRIIRALFERYQAAVEDERYRLFPPGYVERLQGAETEPCKVRAVIDLIAGLTEAAAVQIYQRLCGHSSGSLLGAAGQLP